MKRQIPNGTQQLIASAPDCPNVTPRNPEDDHESKGEVAKLRLQQLGDESLALLNGAKRASIRLAVPLHEAKAILCSVGRGSNFPAWCKHHVPELSRKTVDRLVSVAIVFGINWDNVSDFARLADQFRMTALYRLASPDVPDAARMEAVLAAQAGEDVTTDYVERVLLGDRSPDFFEDHPRINVNSVQVFTKTIPLVAGQVTVTINHDDFAQALTEALDLLQDEEHVGDRLARSSMTLLDKQ